MCNHVESPQTRNLMNDTLLDTANRYQQQDTFLYSDSDVWFRAATIAVPICGAVILFVLIALAVKILKNEHQSSAMHKLGPTMYVHAMPQQSKPVKEKCPHDTFDRTYSNLLREGYVPTHHNTCHPSPTADYQRHHQVPLLAPSEAKNTTNARYNFLNRDADSRTTFVLDIEKNQSGCSEVNVANGSGDASVRTRDSYTFTFRLTITTHVTPVRPGTTRGITRCLCSRIAKQKIPPTLWYNFLKRDADFRTSFVLDVQKNQSGFSKKSVKWNDIFFKRSSSRNIKKLSGELRDHRSQYLSTTTDKRRATTDQDGAEYFMFLGIEVSNEYLLNVSNLNLSFLNPHYEKQIINLKCSNEGFLHFYLPTHHHNTYHPSPTGDYQRHHQVPQLAHSEAKNATNARFNFLNRDVDSRATFILHIEKKQSGCSEVNVANGSGDASKFQTGKTCVS
ncbi:unnamed protein product [Phaedon cochleariae]|uniref:BMP and activin membrane-bound inhibitor C-terminal domain-containing protein n=1 Tax=Phaedon cochleariae TaxID=80249 RepID=A0A9N9X449_PHACE|nr:unnamed protein product [Phaedon cochleariae]